MEKGDLNWKKLIVRIFAKTSEGEKYRGTAFLVNENYLLTARHVIEPFREGFGQDRDRIVLRNGPWDGDQYLGEAPVPHDDRDIDIALLRLRMPNRVRIDYWPLTEYADLSGKRVRIAGFDNEKDPSTAPSFEVSGQISQYSTLTLQEKVQHGKSGGPALLGDRIIGILYARTDAADSRKDQNQTFIYPYGVFKDFLAQHGVSLASPRAKPQTGRQFLHPDERAALIDREKQWDDHIETRIKTETERKTFAFVVAAVKEEWPESLKYRLRMHLQGVEPCAITLKQPQGAVGNWEHALWSSLLNHFLLADYAEPTEPSVLRTKLIQELSASPTTLLFYCFLDPITSRRLDYIGDIAKAWESLEAPASKQQHFLLLVYGTVEKGKGLAFLLRALSARQGERKVDAWRQGLAKKLAEDGPRILTPRLDSPAKDEINYWTRTYLEDIDEQTRFDEALENLKGSKIPHLYCATT